MENSNGLIFKKILAIQNEISAIAKDRTGSGIQYKFRGIDDVYNVVHPLHKKHGVFIMPKMLKAEREERQSHKGGLLIWALTDVQYTFYAEDGSSVVATVRGEAMDTSDKATNKSMAMALKYAIFQMYLIPTEDINHLDTDGSSPQAEMKMPPDVHKMLKKQLEDCSSKEQVLKLYKDVAYQKYLNYPDFTELFDTARTLLKQDGLWTD